MQPAPSAATPARPATRAAATVALVAIVAGAAALRLSSQAYAYRHPDEIITVAVASRIVDEGGVDTNWKLAHVPEQFRLPQYNFSGYLLSGAAVLAAADAVSGRPVDRFDVLRWWSALLGVAVVALTYAVGRQLHDARTGLVAAALAAISPLLFQDTLYARPETFVTVLTLAFVWLLGAPERGRLRVLAASALLGVGIATKISLLALLPALALAPTPRPAGPAPSPRTALGYARACAARLARELPWIGAGLVAGFVAGAPAAVRNVQDYLQGLHALTAQYTGGHWPHGVPEAGLLGRLTYAWGYFAGTHGALLFACALAGVVVALRDRDLRAAGISLVAWAVAVRFGTYAAFFERNVSHVLPLLAVAAAHGTWWCADRAARWIPAPVGAAALLAATAYPAARTTYLIRFDELTGEHALRVDAVARGLESVQGARLYGLDLAGSYGDLQRQLPRSCWPALLSFQDPADARTVEVLRELEARGGYAEIGRVPSLFEGIPTSTLNTYFIPRTVFLRRATRDGRECPPDSEPLRP